MIERIKHKVLWMLRVNVREKTNKWFAAGRRSRLGGGSFTILSNNCWGAHVYRYFGIPYNSPTIGLYIWPDDYLRFLKNLDYYLGQELKFINCEMSNHKELLKIRGEENKPIGLLGDVEIVFLHYNSAAEAKEKWKRRVARIDKNHLLVKCSMQNGMTLEQVKEFDKLDYPHKLIFVPKEMPEIKSAVWYKNSGSKEQVKDDVLYFNRYVNLVEWINSCY